MEETQFAMRRVRKKQGAHLLFKQSYKAPKTPVSPNLLKITGDIFSSQALADASIPKRARLLLRLQGLGERKTPVSPVQGPMHACRLVGF